MADYDFLYDGETIDVSLERNSETFTARVSENEYDLEPIGNNLYRVRYNGNYHVAAVVKHDGKYFIDIDSILIELNDPTDEGFAGGAGGHAGEKDKIFAPMPGKIVKIQVEVGQEIVEKQQMVIVEAMKMENQVLSRAKGVVKAINFADGDQVDTETPIIELDIAEE